MGISTNNLLKFCQIAPLDELLIFVRQDSPTLLVDRLTASIAREDVAKTRVDEFMPTFDVIGEHKNKQNIDTNMNTKKVGENNETKGGET